jgi:hypothetical protein
MQLTEVLRGGDGFGTESLYSPTQTDRGVRLDDDQGDDTMNILNMTVVSGGLLLLSLPLVYAIRTLMKLQSKKIYPVFRLIVVSKGPVPARADCVRREPGG